jgi:hypothetical protein
MLAFLGFALIVCSSRAFADKAEKVQDGVVLSTTAESLVMTDTDGKNERSYKVDGATAVTIDGKPAKLPELNKGDQIKVAMDEDGKVIRIAATRAKK